MGVNWNGESLDWEGMKIRIREGKLGLGKVDWNGEGGKEGVNWESLGSGGFSWGLTPLNPHLGGRFGISLCHPACVPSSLSCWHLQGRGVHG